MLTALSSLAIFTATPASAATSFSDGSFESPVVAPNTFQTFFAGQSIGPWRVTQGSVDLIGQGFWQAADGVQSLDLDGNEQGAVAQTFSTLPLLKYEVSFKLAGNPQSGPTVKTGQVLVNGQVVKKFSFDITGKTFSNMGYVSQEFTFLASGSSTTLEFASTTPGYFGPVIDKVEVESCLVILCP
jgi:choice-of-anchor C domain-containing protein